MANWLESYRAKKKRAQCEVYHTIVMRNHKENIIFDYKSERSELKKRIHYLEQHLDGMGVRDYELTTDERKRIEGEI